MLPYLPKVAISQSLDGSELIITDISNYGTNSDNIDDSDIVTRVVTIYDANGALLITFNMVQDTPYSYQITGDAFFKFHLAFSSAVPTVYQNDVKFISTRYYNNKQLALVPKLRCACPSERVLKVCNRATDLYNAAVDAFMTGDDVNADLNIKDANTYINQPC